MYEYRLLRCGLRQAPEGTPGAVHDSIAAGTVGGFSNWAPGSPACPPPPGRNAPSSGAVTRRYMMYEYGRYGMYEYGRYGMSTGVIVCGCGHYGVYECMSTGVMGCMSMGVMCMSMGVIECMSTRSV